MYLQKYRFFKNQLKWLDITNDFCATYCADCQFTASKNEITHQ